MKDSIIKATGRQLTGRGDGQPEQRTAREDVMAKLSKDLSLPARPLCGVVLGIVATVAWCGMSIGGGRRRVAPNDVRGPRASG